MFPLLSRTSVLQEGIVTLEQNDHVLGILYPHDVFKYILCDSFSLLFHHPRAHRTELRRHHKAEDLRFTAFHLLLSTISLIISPDFKMFGGKPTNPIHLALLALLLTHVSATPVPDGSFPSTEITIMGAFILT